jgi:hypothetical protein
MITLTGRNPKREGKRGNMKEKGKKSKNKG